MDKSGSVTSEGDSRRGIFWAAILGGLCALAAVAFTPLDRLPAWPNFDGLYHCDNIASAAEALGEGQWLLREIPRINPVEQEEYHRFPLFQFYSVLPYLLGGTLVRLGLMPYYALVFLVAFFFWFGFQGVYFLTRRRGVSVGGALAAAVVFTFAPYHLTDWYGRFAFPELAAFSLLPWVFWAGLGAAEESGLGNLLVLALAWAALILTHNIYHAWGLVFFGAYFAVIFGVRRPGLAPLARLGFAYALSLGLTAAFFAPVFFVGRYFHLAARRYYGEIGTPPLWVLLSPFHVTTELIHSQLPLMSLQVGWLILAAAVFWLARRWKTAWKDAELICFVLAFFVVWSPYNFWPLAGPLRVVQFPYRILPFTTLFGALLAGQAFELIPGPSRLKWMPFLLVTLLVPWTAFSNPPRGDETPADQRDYQAQKGMTVRIPKNFRCAFHHFTLSPTEYPDLNAGSGPKPARLDHGRLTTVEWKNLRQKTVVILPALWYPGLYRVTVDGQRGPYGRSGYLLAVELGPGDHKVEYEFTGLPWANILSLAACGLWLGLAVLAGVLHKKRKTA